MAGAGAKLFVDGTILDAVGINTYLMDQAVMRFASTAARDAAFGGAGEPVLAEGMFAYTNDTNTLWFYTGSAWEVATIKPSLVDAKGDLIAGTAADTVDRLAVGTNGQVLVANSSASTGLAWANAGLTLVKSQTIGTGVSTVTVTDAFNGTYDNYRIIISGGVGSANANISMVLGSTTANYAYNNIYMAYNSTTVTGEASNSASSWLRVARSSANNIDAEIEIKSPFETKRTIGQWRMSSSASNELWSIGGGYLNDATSYTAFTLTTSTGTLTGGTIRVYGYTNS
jgi:hypothetical protein